MPKDINIQIRDQILKQLNIHIWDQVAHTYAPPGHLHARARARCLFFSPVWDQVNDQVHDPVWDQVRDQVLDPIWNQVHAQIQNQGTSK